MGLEESVPGMGTVWVWGVWGEHPRDGHGVGRASLGYAKPRFGECGVIISGICSVRGVHPWDVPGVGWPSVGYAQSRCGECDNSWDMLSVG